MADDVGQPPLTLLGGVGDMSSSVVLGYKSTCVSCAAATPRTRASLDVAAKAAASLPACSGVR